MDAPALGERLRELRMRKKISLRELARRAGISPSFLSEMESGRSYPSELVLGRLAAELEVSEASLRKLDMRHHLSELRGLLEDDSAWGPVFKEVAKIGRAGVVSPHDLLARLKSK